jgi:hypothetical protein
MIAYGAFEAIFATLTSCILGDWLAILDRIGVEAARVAAEAGMNPGSSAASGGPQQSY